MGHRWAHGCGYVIFADFLRESILETRGCGLSGRIPETMKKQHLVVIIEFFVSRSSGSIPAARFVFSTGSIDCRFSVTETERLLVTDAQFELGICRTDCGLSDLQVSSPNSQKRRNGVHRRATSPRGLAAPRASLSTGGPLFYGHGGATRFFKKQRAKSSGSHSPAR